MRTIGMFAAGFGLCWSIAGPACAQESINAADSATQPSPGHVIFKEQFRYYDLDLDETDANRRGEINDVLLLTTLNVGIDADLSLSFRLPTIVRRHEFHWSEEDERTEGVGDFTALAKWRVYRNDTAVLDSARFSLLGGVQVRTGDGPFTSEGYNPILGMAYTQIAGRHGFNGALEWTFTTSGNDEPIYAGESSADVFRYDLAYLYRLSPREYSADTHGALYALCEVNGLYETNGDNELFLSPGLMYEAKTWTAELSIQLPTWQDIDHRAEANYVLVAGIRLAF